MTSSQSHKISSKKQFVTTWGQIQVSVLHYATEGCPVDCGESWTSKQQEAAIQQGPHLTAKSPEAAACL